MSTKDKLPNLEILKASQDYLDNKVSDLKSAVDEIKGVSRNIYNGKFVSNSFVESDTYDSTTYKFAGGHATPVESGKKYTFSIDGTATTMRYVFTDAEENDIGSLANASTTETAPSNAKYLKWRTYSALPTGFANMQLEAGDTVTQHVNHFTAIDTEARDEIANIDEQIDDFATIEYVDGFIGSVRAASIKNADGSALSPVSFVDALSSAINGMKFTEDLVPRTKITQHFSHGGEMVKTSAGIFVVTPTNDVDTGDSPSSTNLYSVIVKIDSSTYDIVQTYELAKYGDTDADGDTIVSGVSVGPVRVLNNQIYCFLTAKTDKYYQYYTIFDPSSGTHTALTKCTLNGVAFSAEQACTVAEITVADTFLCLHGLIGNNSGTYYAALALGGNRQLNRGMILHTTDMVNYTMLVIPDLGSDCMVNFEIACCYYDGYIYISERQLNRDTQILAKLTTSGVVSQQTEIPDGQAKASFFVAEDALYLVHNVFDRFHVEIVKINPSFIRRSVSVMVSNSDNVYPFMYYDNGVLYLVSSRDSTSRVFLSHTTLPESNTAHVYDLLKTLENYTVRS